MKLLNIGFCGLSYAKQLIITYEWHCQECGTLKDNDVRMFDDIFDNHYCKKCDHQVELIKDSVTYHRIQLLKPNQFKQLKTFLSW